MAGIGLLMLGILLLGSCATISEKRVQQESDAFFQALDRGDTEYLSVRTMRPFLFETEILVSAGLVDELWMNLSALEFSNAEMNRILTVDEESYSIFSNSWEAEQWFHNYVSNEDVLVFYSWRDRELVVVMDRSRSAEARILGFGEVRE